MPILSIGVKADEAVSGAQQASGAIDGVAKSATRLETVAKKVNGAILNLARGFTGFGLALSAVSIGAWLRDVVRSEAALLAFSNRTGIAVEDLSVLDFMAKKSGRSLADFENAISNMAQTFDSAAQGEENAIRLLDRLQISEEQAKATTNDIGKQLELVSKGFQRVGDASKLASVGTGLFARQGDANAASLAKMVQDLPRVRAELEAVGLVLSRKDAIAAREADEAINQFGAAMTKVGAASVTFGVNLSKGVFSAAAALVEGGDALDAFNEGWDETAKEAARAAKAVAAFRIDAERTTQQISLEKAIQALKEETDVRKTLAASVGQTTDAREAEVRRVEVGVEVSKAAANANHLEATKKKELLAALAEHILGLRTLSAEQAKVAQADALIRGIEDQNKALRDNQQDSEEAAESLKVLASVSHLTAEAQRTYTDALKKAQDVRRQGAAENAAHAFARDLERELDVLRQATKDPVFREADVARLQAIQSYDKETEAIRRLSTQQQAEVARVRLLVQVKLAEKAALEAVAAARATVQGLKDETEFLHLNNQEREIRIKLREFDRATVAAGGNEEVRLLREEYEARLRLNQALEKTRQLAGDVSQALTQGLEDAILSAESLTDALRQVYLELARIGLRTFLTGPANNFLTGLFSGFLGGGSGGGGGLFSAKGNAFAGGRLLPFARGGVVSRPTIFPMATGAGLMGEKGPEAVMPLRQGPGGLSVRADILGGLLPIGRIGGDLGIKLFGQGGVVGYQGPSGGTSRAPGTQVYLTQNVTIRGGDGGGSSAASRKSARQVAGDFRRAIERAGG